MAPKRNKGGDGMDGFLRWMQANREGLIEVLAVDMLRTPEKRPRPYVGISAFRGREDSELGERGEMMVRLGKGMHLKRRRISSTRARAPTRSPMRFMRTKARSKVWCLRMQSKAQTLLKTKTRMAPQISTPRYRIPAAVSRTKVMGIRLGRRTLRTSRMELLQCHLLGRRRHQQS